MSGITNFSKYVDLFSKGEHALEEMSKKVDPNKFYEEKIKPHEKRFIIYIGMRGLLAQLVELVIAWDRQCFLKENGCESKLYYIYKGQKSHHNIAIYAKR